MDPSQWTKGTVINQNVAAGRQSPTKNLFNGIQGGHALLHNDNGSPQSRQAVQNLRNSHQPHQVSILKPTSQHAQDAQANVNRSNSSSTLLTRDWATSNQVTYGLSAKQTTIDPNKRAGRATGPHQLMNSRQAGEPTRNDQIRVSGKRTVANANKQGAYNPIQGTLINNGPMVAGSRGVARDMTPQATRPIVSLNSAEPSKASMPAMSARGSNLIAGPSQRRDAHSQLQHQMPMKIQTGGNFSPEQLPKPVSIRQSLGAIHATKPLQEDYTHRIEPRRSMERIEPMSQKRKSIDDQDQVTYDSNPPIPVAVRNSLGMSGGVASAQLTPQRPSQRQQAYEQVKAGNMTLPQVAKRRHLPIEGKKKVFNEWGAVLRHQDEAEQRAKEEELNQQRQLQMAFKMNLDEQRQKRQQELLQKKERDRSEDNDMLKIQAQQEQQRYAVEERKRLEIRENVRQKAKESIQEKERLREANKQKEEIYREATKKRYLEEQKQEAEYKNYQREMQLQEQRNYADVLNQQKRQRDETFIKSKQEDKVFLEQESRKLDQDEEGRARHFMKLKDFQNRNDAKYEQLRSYQAQGNFADAAKRDEERMLKNQADREKSEREEMQRRRDAEARNKTEANQMLRLQMAEKERQRELSKQNDAIYASQVAQRVHNVEDQERAREQKRREDKADYFNTLNQQIKTEKQRKKYDILMTEHERRVHDKTIKAYEAYEIEAPENQGVAKLGSNYTAIQQKYIRKAFGSNGSPTGSPMMNQAKRPNLNEMVNVAPNPYGNVVGANLQSASQQALPQLGSDAKRQPSQLAMAGSLNMLGMSAKVGAGAAPKLSNAQQLADEDRLKKVMDNMEKEKSLQFRQNTNNRGYGFQQVIKNEVPKDKMHRNEKVGDNSYSDYRFTVAGNQGRGQVLKPKTNN